MTEPTPVDQLAYTEALSELETILDRLEHDEPDVDRLAVDVARASQLIAHLRARITAARLQVEEVVGGLTPPTAPSGTAEPEPIVDAGAELDDSDDVDT